MSAALPRCVGEPISWPRLEQLAAGALDATLAASIEAHVAACPACRACLDEIAFDVVALPALPATAPPAPSWWTRWARWLFAGGGLAVAAAAVLLLWFARAHPRGAAEPGPRVAVKGAGAVVLSIVRDRGGAIAHDPISFRADDRWKVRVTCDPGPSIWADVVVYQADRAGLPARAAFPLPAASVPCGNDVTLPGAFRITGTTPALVCVALATGAAPDRAVVAHGPTSGQIACAALAPE